MFTYINIDWTILLSSCKVFISLLVHHKVINEIFNASDKRISIGKC